MAPFSEALTSDEGGDRVGAGRGKAREIGSRGNRLLVDQSDQQGGSAHHLYRIYRAEETEEGSPTGETGPGSLRFHPYYINEGSPDAPVRIAAR